MRYYSSSILRYGRQQKHAGDKKIIQKRFDLTLLILLHDNSAYGMQGKKHLKKKSAQNSDKTSL
jgi:nicotinamide riboside kinase